MEVVLALNVEGRRLPSNEGPLKIEKDNVGETLSFSYEWSVDFQPSVVMRKGGSVDKDVVKEVESIKGYGTVFILLYL